MSELFGNQEKKELLKDVIKKIHQSEDPERVKEEFKKVIELTSPDEIASVEEELIQEGVPREEIRALCDVHLAVFNQSLERPLAAPEGHPLHILMEEHKILLNHADEVVAIVQEMKEGISLSNQAAQLRTIAEHFAESECHYIREENVLFPYLERHDQIREIKKRFYTLVDTWESMETSDFVGKLEEVGFSLAEKYFSQSKERIFPRTKAVIGRKVQQCHPQKSVHVVNQILNEFKDGTRDTAEFWINLQGQLIYIRYFAVRSKGEYLGCVEVTQDITEIRKIQGEKRLLG